MQVKCWDSQQRPVRRFHRQRTGLPALSITLYSRHDEHWRKGCFFGRFLARLLRSLAILARHTSMALLLINNMMSLVADAPALILRLEQALHRFFRALRPS